MQNMQSYAHKTASRRRRLIVNWCQLNPEYVTKLSIVPISDAAWRKMQFRVQRL